ncbi:type 1 glutamine amidotransferase [Poseidonocella sedimentorum]|uniref:Glutamine amidotransferase class-I n=1 Tax=Poseidonocella sedimentorum TaxID=871652 RepID=A0A1I6CXN2_9RHOB|nr:type 1 glutamine amidotransferase [Poseidonocella sedimentorum]SFQ97867.1 Glutamine amidotransferase class-I [Poseidonocella sedimentorum]
MHIGILQAGHAPRELEPETGDYAEQCQELLSGQGFTFSTFNVVDDAFPDSADAAEGWLITGSRHGAYDPLPWIARLEALIREIVAAQKPLVGICFGHQIIAQALGGKVEKYARGWAVGRHGYTLLGEAIALNAWHQDQITALPEGAEVVGSSPFCRYAALQYGPRIFSLQPHPEYGPRMLRGLIELRGPNVVPADLLQVAEESLDAPTDAPFVAAHMGAVLRGEART